MGGGLRRWSISTIPPPVDSFNKLIGHHSLPRSAPEAGKRKKSRTPPNKDILINTGCLCDLYGTNVLSTWVVGALGLCLCKHNDGKDNEKEINEQIKFLTAVTSTPKSRVFLVTFPDVYGVIMPCYWNNQGKKAWNLQTCDMVLVCLETRDETQSNLIPPKSISQTEMLSLKNSNVGPHSWHHPFYAIPCEHSEETLV